MTAPLLLRFTEAMRCTLCGRVPLVLFRCFRYALLESMSIEAVLYAEDDKLPANEARCHAGDRSEWSGVEWPLCAFQFVG